MKKYFKYFVFVVLVCLAIFYYFYNDYQNFKSTEFSIDSINIESWDSWKKVINKLCENIENCFNLDLYSNFNNVSDVKKWVYSFSWETITWIFEQFKEWPPINYVKYTIIPWETKFDIKAKLEEKSSKAIADKFLKLVSDKDFIAKLDYEFLNDFKELESLEGFLYPDTYYFKPSDLESIMFPELLIKTSLKNFQKKWSWIICNQNCNPYDLNNYENLIFASIVEKESKYSKNKPLIADVLIKRYINDWKIWADWTLCYGLKVSSNNCQKYLTNRYLKDKWNKYNTRAVIWLPPTPIWNPTIDSIKSTILSTKNDFWYYLHDKKGNIHFSKTIKEHNYKKNKYLR